MISLDAAFRSRVREPACRARAVPAGADDGIV